MRRLLLIVIAGLTGNLLSCSRPAGEVHLSDYVSTLVGTQSDWTFSTGNTYPAIALPWGMNFWTPVTAEREDDGWAYQYGGHRITGFKQTHQPSPWINDYGAFSIIPGGGPSWFSHKSEIAKPYYYKVYLADHDITVEITPSERAAVMRLTFPESDSSVIEVNPFQGGGVVFDGGGAIGYSVQNHGGVPEGFRNHFVIKADAPLGERFATSRGQVVTLYIASSFISEDQALRNLEEVLDRPFDKVKSAAQSRWDEILGRIRVSGGSEEQYRTFYSCLYRSTLFPRKFYEIGPDGEPVHYSPYDGKVHDGYLYTDTGFWDTFRALFPLLNLVYPDVSTEILQGLANVARENEFLPEWASPGHRDCMIGNNSAAVVADAAAHGLVSREDLEVLYKALFTERSHSWRNFFDSETGFVRGRTSNGGWRTPFNPFYALHRSDDYCEGNAWQYTWLVPQDLSGLMECFGGRNATLEHLDSLFTAPETLGPGAPPDMSGLIGQYVHGNEPSHHIVYFYTMMGQPWKTADKVRQILSEQYGTGYDGLSGNEDVGQMSAWYILSALGFYQVEPASTRFWFGRLVGLEERHFQHRSHILILFHGAKVWRSARRLSLAASPGLVQLRQDPGGPGP